MEFILKFKKKLKKSKLSNMKKRRILLNRGGRAIFTTLLFSVGFVYLQGQVGIGNDNPSGILDLTNVPTTSKTYPLVVPTSEADNLVINPKSSTSVVAGSIFYDVTEKCLKVYNGTQWNCIDVATILGCASVIATSVATPDHDLSNFTGISSTDWAYRLVMNKLIFPKGIFNVGDVVITGSGGEVFKVKEIGVTSLVDNGFTLDLDQMVSDPEYEWVMTLSLEDPPSFNNSSTFKIHPPFSNSDMCQLGFMLIPPLP